MTVSNQSELRQHLGHNLECVKYGDSNIVVECVDCNTILYEEFKSVSNSS